MATEHSEPQFPFIAPRPAAEIRSRRERARAERPALQRISGPSELLQAVPYLLGFHPHDSVVLVGLTQGRLVVTARVDLPVLADRSLEGGPARSDPTIAQTLRALADGGATEVIAAVYADKPHTGVGTGLAHREVVDVLAHREVVDVLAHGEVVDVVMAETQRRGCTLVDAVLVREGRWWSYLCEAADCCSVDGTAVPDTISSFAAAATVEGVAPMPDRAALAALLDPVAGDALAALQPLIAAAEDAEVQAVLSGGRRRHERAAVRRLFAAARASEQPGWTGIENDDTAAFGAALASVGVRDAVWMGVDDGRIDGRELWRELGRRLPPPYCAAPLFLFGWASWRSGDGALAAIAADRAVSTDPGYTAADLLLAALDGGVDPRRLPRLRLARGA